MEWFFIEAFVALVIAIAIVWWTMVPRKKDPAARNAEAVAEPEEKT
jgi:hypothetical protein